MNLLSLLNSIVEDLDALIRASADPLEQAQLTKLRDAYDAMSDQAVHQLFDSASADYASAIKSLTAATADAKAGAADVSKIGQAIKSAVTAANAVDKLIGFLAHLP
ncbi:MAG TPA: hypothetical protein VKG78_08480 [Opitutaceae bacterium]|nr:hypothetical protein [Opitutaceae bacterium]